SAHVFLSVSGPTDITPLSLHDALPIYRRVGACDKCSKSQVIVAWGHATSSGFAFAMSRLEPRSHLLPTTALAAAGARQGSCPARSEEHTSELQSRENLVCRLLLEKKEE